METIINNITCWITKKRNTTVSPYEKPPIIYKKNNIIKKVDIKIIDHLQDNDIYDFIFLTVRENQLYQALKELKSNKSKTIITMVNTLDNYEK